MYTVQYVVIFIYIFDSSSRCNKRLTQLISHGQNNTSHAYLHYKGLSTLSRILPHCCFFFLLVEKKQK